MPPRLLTIWTASLAALTQPCPICPKLPLTGYSPPMFTAAGAASEFTVVAPYAVSTPVATVPRATVVRKSLRVYRRGDFIRLGFSIVCPPLGEARSHLTTRPLCSCVRSRGPDMFEPGDLLPVAVQID